MTKPSQRSVPQKQGLQSLGKIPTARRAPANLPSLKAETSGEPGSKPTAPASAPSSAPASAGWRDDSSGGRAADDARAGGNSNDVGSAGGGGGGGGGKASWLGPGPIGGPAAAAHLPMKPKPSFLHQESPLFGQEFPSLGGSGVPGVGSGEQGLSKSASASGIASHQQGVSAAAAVSGNAAAKAQETKYGPGPNLRPQTSGNWMFGGGQKQEGGGSDHKEGKSGSAPPPSDFPTKNIFPPPPPVMMPITAPKGLDGRRGGPGGPGRGGGHMANNGPQSNRSGVTPVAIIDREKLKRMDFIDATEDDWAKTDDTFDYNKKLAR